MNTLKNNRQHILINILNNITNVFQCDKIAYIQCDIDSSNDFIITPSQAYQGDLLKDNLYDIILKYSKTIDVPVFINKDHEIYKLHNLDCSILIIPISLYDDYRGCLIIVYLDSKHHSECVFKNLAYYKLASEIIITEENSFMVKEELRQINQYYSILNDLSEKLLKMKDSEMDCFIQLCIQKVCQNWDIDRGYLYIVDFKNKKLNKTNEWCNAGIESLLVSEPHVDFDKFPWNYIIELFTNEPNNIIHIPNMLTQYNNVLDGLVKEECILDIKESLNFIINDKNLKSVLIIPVSDTIDSKCYTLAILGFSQISRMKIFSEKLIKMTNVLSCYIAEAIKRRRTYNQSRRIDEETLQNILKWRSENIKNNEIYESIQAKMKSIFEDTRHLVK